MHESDTATREELRVLRERAYGPAADIDQDPAAAQRLRELESRSVSLSAVRADTPAPVEQPTPVAAGPIAADAGEDPAVETPAPAGEARSLPRRVAVLWALSVAAAASAAAAITFSFTYIAPVPESAGATQIATLEPTTAVSAPAGFMGAEEDSLLFEFFGYTLFEANGGFAYSMSSGSDCFVIIASDQVPVDFDAQGGWSIETPVYSGCGAGGFPAVAQFVVDSTAPDAMRAEFPEGTAVRFVFDGERVGVFADRG